jgi:hypothetical protein
MVQFLVMNHIINTKLNLNILYNFIKDNIHILFVHLKSKNLSILNKSNYYHKLNNLLGIITNNIPMNIKN